MMNLCDDPGRFIRQLILPVLCSAVTSSGALASGLEARPAPDDSEERFTASRQRGGAGDAAASAEVGLAYLHGIGTKRDPVQAWAWLEFAAEGGSPVGRLAVARRDIVHRRSQRGAAQSIAAAGLSDAEARAAHGQLRLAGLGLERDPAIALIHLTDAAKAGSAEADYTLGRLYLTGRDVPRNEALGRSRLQAAADAGHEGAMMALARHLSRSRQHAEIEEALLFAKRAAQAGHPSGASFAAELRSRLAPKAAALSEASITSKARP